MVRPPETTVAQRGPPCWCQPNTPPGAMVYRITVILDTSACTIPVSVLNFAGTASGNIPEPRTSPVTPDPGVAPTLLTGKTVLTRMTATVRARTTSFFGLHDTIADISTSIRFVKYRDHGSSRPCCIKAKNRWHAIVENTQLFKNGVPRFFPKDAALFPLPKPQPVPVNRIPASSKYCRHGFP